MELSYAFFVTITSVFGTLIALFVFRAIVVPAAIYCYHLAVHGQEKAEKEALDSMGENKMSYALKDILTRDTGIDQPGIKQVQDGVANTAGSLVDKGAPAEAAGKTVSDVGDGLMGGASAAS